MAFGAAVGVEAVAFAEGFGVATAGGGEEGGSDGRRGALLEGIAHVFFEGDQLREIGTEFHAHFQGGKGVGRAFEDAAHAIGIGATFAGFLDVLLHFDLQGFELRPVRFGGEAGADFLAGIDEAAHGHGLAGTGQGAGAGGDALGEVGAVQLGGRGGGAAEAIGAFIEGEGEAGKTELFQLDGCFAQDGQRRPATGGDGGLQSWGQGGGEGPVVLILSGPGQKLARGVEALIAESLHGGEQI